MNLGLQTAFFRPKGVFWYWLRFKGGIPLS